MAAVIFKGKRAKTLTQKGLELKDGSIIDNDGALNYVKNGHAEVNALGWATYADAAASRPVDGTGGSPNITWARSTSSPLSGDASFLFTKDAANRQGQGVSYDITIDEKDKAEVLQISFDYQIASGTYSGGTPSTDSDLIVYVYRTTATGRLIEPSVIKLDGSVIGVNYSYRGEFQADSDATGYRIIVHVATTSASAFTVKVDNVIVGPSKNVSGAITTPWVAYTPTVSPITGFATGPLGYWRRVGDSMEIVTTFRKNGSVGTGSADLTISLPSGYSMDTTKILSAGAGLPVLGFGETFGILGASQYDRHIPIGYSSATTLAFAKPAAGVFYIGTEVAANSFFSLNAKVPILSWGATAVLGQDADTRVAAALLGQSAAQSIPNAFADTLVQFDTKTIDTHGATTTGASAKFTAPISGLYSIKAQVAYAAAGTGIRYVIRVRKNSSVINSYELDYTAVGAGIISLPVNTLVSLNSGETIDVVTAHTGAGSQSLSGGTAFNYVSVERMSGPSQIAATETVALSVAGTTSTVTSSQATVAPWTTVEVDTNGSFNATTGVWTCPASGVYSISAQLRFGWASVTVGQAVLMSIYKNNTTDLAFNQETVDVSTKTFVVMNVDRVVRLVAGDTIRIQASNAATTPTINTSAAYGLLSIVRIGQ